MHNQTILIFLAVLLGSAPMAGFAADLTPRQILTQGSATHKLVFDLTAATLAPGAVHPGLAAVARLNDTYCDQGARPQDVHIVVVLHGAVTALLRDKANGAAMKKLADDGVFFVVSRPSLALRHIADSELPPYVAAGPSADLIFFNFEENGYVYSGTGSLFKD